MLTFPDEKTYVKRCLCSPQDNREKGENPLRSRRCMSGAALLLPLGNREGVRYAQMLESEDLPFTTDVFHCG